MKHILSLFTALLLAPLAVLHGADANLTRMSGAAGTPQAGVPASRPNVLIILVDDMGWGDPQCFNPQSKIATPVKVPGFSIAAMIAVWARGCRITPSLLMSWDHDLLVKACVSLKSGTPS
jgi:hypothetical protein